MKTNKQAVHISQQYSCSSIKVTISNLHVGKLVHAIIIKGTILYAVADDSSSNFKWSDTEVCVSMTFLQRAPQVQVTSHNIIISVTRARD